MFNRPFSTVLTRLAIVAAILATLLLMAPAASAATSKLKYAENGTDPVARFSATDEDGHPIVWTLNGDDKGDFAISKTGVLTFKKSPNFESPADKNLNNVYLVTVKASEASELKIEVTVTDVDEPGTVSLSQLQPQVGRSMSATLKDPDSGVEDERWQWAKGASATGPFVDIDKATSATRSPVAADVGMYLRATVVYQDGFGTGKTVSAVSENAVEEKTTANAAPSFAGLDSDDDTAGSQVERDVDEGVTGANVGRPITATDADNDVLLYSITAGGATSDGKGGDAGSKDLAGVKALFSIDTRSGQLKTKTKTLDSDDDGLVDTDNDSNAGSDDNNGESTYTLTVTATDPSGATGTATVTVTINDVNDDPKITAATTTTASANQPALTVVENDTTLAPADPTYTAMDDDAGDTDTTNTSATPPTVALEYSVEGADKGVFAISDAGALTFKSGTKVNYEDEERVLDNHRRHRQLHSRGERHAGRDGDGDERGGPRQGEAVRA